MDNYFKASDILDKAIGTDAYFPIKSILLGTKTADVAPVRHGRWEFPIFADSDDELDPRGRCSECGSVEVAFARWKYCPNCGCCMLGGGEDDTIHDVWGEDG